MSDIWRPRVARAVKALRSQLRAPFAATAGAAVLLWASLTPSLMPRTALFQALLTALCMLAGYGAGALAGWLVRSCGGRLAGRARVIAWRVLAVVGGIGTLVALGLSLRWENEVRDLVGVDRVGVGHLVLSVLITAVLFALLLGLSRGSKALGSSFGRFVGRFLPAAPSTVIGGLLAAVLIYQLAIGVGGNRLLGALDASFATINEEFSTGVPAPTSPELTAGPASSQAWEALGRQGRVFVASAPTAADIGEFTQEPARQPVRAYVGAGPEGVDIRDEARTAVAELDALGGFDRAVINVVTGTGRGWVNENQAQALEFMWGGDTATVSLQYSYLPSWMSFILDRQRAQDAGLALFDAIYGRWLEIPEADRPLLVVSGESLGSFGGEAAFSGDHDLATRTDGALFVGPTADNRLWDRFTEEREPGTPQVLPVLDEGEIVRFADRPDDWQRPGTWEGTRIGYLQHANDPITWWTPSVALERPDWLGEERGRDVSPNVRWIPGVTMLQLGVDQFSANSVPSGQGHQFGTAPVHAWAAILPPPGWTDQRTDELAAVIGAREWLR
ncbi:alpha/beta-hydrolase family protein [Nocardioides sp.]|uniref:alpha/beta hydrolase n=1 Tax=Nocardioides sp. TaxID=35761 RepID=UPI0019AC3313|nr:alpha/beta-hydrolase family protein [Nocardioides sp.]MBC7275788.1 alpha/beta-hydrolase family protein [Nocardioides sp.]